MYLPLPPLLDNHGDTIGERSLALSAQHAFERHPGGAGNRVVPVLPAPDIAITSDQQRSGHLPRGQPERLAAAAEQRGFSHFVGWLIACRPTGFEAPVEV